MTRLVGLLALLSIGGACRKKESPPPPPPPPVVVVAPPAIVPDAARDIGTMPFRVDSVRANRWTDKPTWVVRLNFMVTRLRELPEGTELRTKLSCLVGATLFADGKTLLVHTQGLIPVGESTGFFVDPFFWSRLPADAVPTRCDLLVFAQMPGEISGVIDHAVARYCIVPAGEQLTVNADPCPPIAEAPPPPSAADRDLGTVPFRLDRVNPERRTDTKDWVVRLYLYVSRLRDVPRGTELKETLSCLVGSAYVVEPSNVGVPSGPIKVGDSAPTFVDHFAHAKLAKAPTHCELLVYAQMPGARDDVIDHEVGRVCIVPGRSRAVDDFKTTVGPCPLLQGKNRQGQ